ncbi:MAG: glutathione synthase [Gammaproteobacteria bacterium]|nr:glutathione synthase [Gammaproteobacteria bacterium]
MMDPIESINIKKDSTFAVMLAAQKLGHDVFYTEGKHVFLDDGQVRATVKSLYLIDDPQRWFDNITVYDELLDFFDVIWVRMDPPFDASYLYITQLLDLVDKKSTRIINNPRSIRDCNEKLFAQSFPDLCPPTLVSKDSALIKKFLEKHERIVLKPLDGMGGKGIFYLDQQDKNKHVILETVTRHHSEFIMAQRFLPEIAAGDKRITMIDGEPLDYAVARIPPADDLRGNLAVGGQAKVIPLTVRDRYLCKQLSETLKQTGLFWVGVDVIGDYITEINVTSPTCLREVESHTGISLAELLVLKA